MTAPRRKSPEFDFLTWHRHTKTVERDEQGRANFLGYVLQFGEWTVYHGGDTIRYPGMAEKLLTFGVHVAFNTAPPDKSVTECRRLGQPCRVLRCGERWDSEKWDE
jgi:hypothetical protein